MARPSILNLLPGAVRAGPDDQSSAPIVANIIWLLLERLLKAVIGVSVTVWVARYLGPSDFGLLSYALALVGIFGAVGALGLETITVRELVRSPSEADRVLGSAFILRLGAGTFAFLVCLLAASLIRPGDFQAFVITAIIAVSLIFSAIEVLRYWFDSRTESRFGVWATITAILISSLGRITLILYRAPLIYFAWMALVEAALIAAGFVLAYRIRGRRLLALRPSLTTAKNLLSNSWPLLLSGLAVMLYMRIDQLMLARMTEADVLGQYAASVKISEVWNTIPTVVMITLFPAMIRSSEGDSPSVGLRLQRMLALLAASALLISIVITGFAHGIITYLFGPSYDAAGAILRVHVWSSVFVFLGVAGNRWYVARDLQRHALYFTATGAVANVALNLWLIPLHGAIGAAIATLVSYAIAGYLLDVVSAKTRPMFAAKTRALLLLPALIPHRRE